MLTEFLKAYPEVKVHLVLGDHILNLIDHHIDVAVRVGNLPDSGMIATKLGTIRRVTCASPRYIAAHGRPSVPHELSGHRCVSFDFIAASNSWRFDLEGGEAEVPVSPQLIVSTAEAAIDAAVLGAGITNIFSYQIEAQLRGGNLELLLRQYEPKPLPVNFLYTERGRLPLKLRALVDFAAPRLRARLSDAEAALSIGAALKARARPSKSMRERRTRG